MTNIPKTLIEFVDHPGAKGESPRRAVHILINGQEVLTQAGGVRIKPGLGGDPVVVTLDLLPTEVCFRAARPGDVLGGETVLAPEEDPFS